MRRCRTKGERFAKRYGIGAYAVWFLWLWLLIGVTSESKTSFYLFGNALGFVFNSHLGYTILREEPKNRTNFNFATCGYFLRRYRKLILLSILFWIIIHGIGIQYLILLVQVFTHNLISSIIDASKFISNSDNWVIYKNAFFPPPLKTLDPNEYSCPVRRDIGPIDVVYTWVNGSDPEFIKNIGQLKTAKKILSKRFYGEFLYLIISDSLEI